MQTELSSDKLFLIACFTVLAFTIFLAAWRTRRPRRSMLIHAGICALYALPLLGGLYDHYNEPESLDWFLLAICAVVLHGMVNVGLFLFLLLRK